MILDECIINEYLTIKLEKLEFQDWQDGAEGNFPGGKDYIAGFYYDERIYIYIKGERYNLYKDNNYEKFCRDLQRWYLSNYDCSLIPRNLAFPLLKKLIESGDPLAIKVGDKEILRGLRERKIDKRYRDILSRKMFWDSYEIDTSILQDLEKLIQKKIEFSIRNNKIASLKLNNSELAEFPEQITQLENLKRLSLRNNHLIHLPNSIQNLKELIFLDLSNNQFQEFPPVLLRMTSLTTLHMRGNNFEVPNDLLLLKEIREFSYGEQTNPNSKIFPEVFCHMENLTRLIFPCSIEIFPPSIEFLVANKIKITPYRNFWDPYKIWKKYFEHNKKLCRNCQEAYHTDNFPMCYKCLKIYDHKFREDPIAYTQNLKYFNYKEWLESSEPNEIYKEKIEQSIKNKGIFSYPKEVQSLVKKNYKNFYKHRLLFKDLENPKLLPLFRKAIFETYDKIFLVGKKQELYSEFSEREGIENQFRKYYYRDFYDNLRYGIFFNDIFLEEMKSKITPNFIPEKYDSLVGWFKKFALKAKLKEFICEPLIQPRSRKSQQNLSLHQDTYLDEHLTGYFEEYWIADYVKYEAFYGIVDDFIVVKCNFEYHGYDCDSFPRVRISNNYPNKVIILKAHLKEVPDARSGGTYPIFIPDKFGFISDIPPINSMSQEELEQTLKDEINYLIDLFETEPSRDNFKSTSFDNLPDRYFVRVILFEEPYKTIRWEKTSLNNLEIKAIRKEYGF